FSPFLTLIGVIAVALDIACLQLLSKRNVLLNQQILHEQGKALATAMGGLQAIEALKASGAENDFFNKWVGYHTKVVNLRQQAGVTTQYLTSFPKLLTTL